MCWDILGYVFNLQFEELVGNGLCDYGARNVQCNFDGGDCCVGNHHWIGDGYCDDIINREGPVSGNQEAAMIFWKYIRKMK